MEEQSAEISSMEGIFKKAMLISAHFKYMAEDWRNGRECNGASGTNLTKAFERYVFYFAFTIKNGSIVSLANWQKIAIGKNLILWIIFFWLNILVNFLIAVQHSV